MKASAAADALPGTRRGKEGSQFDQPSFELKPTPFKQCPLLSQKLVHSISQYRSLPKGVGKKGKSGGTPPVLSNPGALTIPLLKFPPGLYKATRLEFKRKLWQTDSSQLESKILSILSSCSFAAILDAEPNIYPFLGRHVPSARRCGRTLGDRPQN